MNLGSLIEYYIPLEGSSEKSKAVFESLVSLLQKKGVHKDAIVDSLFSFLSHKEHIQIALGWIESNKITVGDSSLYELQPQHKHEILKCLFRSKHFEPDTKMEMMQKIFSDDKSDIVDRCRAACIASLPNPEIKAKVWAEITDPNNSDSLYVRQAKMNGFYGHD